MDILCCCEGCGKRFGIELDTATDFSDQFYEPKLCSDFEHLTREAILAGDSRAYTWGVRGKNTVERFQLTYQPTIQGGYMLCDECSKKCDDLSIEENLTKEQVRDCLNMIEL